MPGRVEQLPNSLSRPFTTQVTGQGWQCAREDEGSGVRGIGQGRVWGAVAHRLFGPDCFADEFTGLDTTAQTPSGIAFVYCLDCEDSWDETGGLLWFKLSSQMTDDYCT